MFRHLHDVSLITEHHMIICTHPPTSFFVDLSIYTISFCSLLFSFDAFHFSDDQRTRWLLTESNFGENKMFQPYWTNVALPLLRLLQQEVCASLTGTRTLPFFFQKDAFRRAKASGSLSADRREFCGEICGKLSPVWAPVTLQEPEMGVKNERPLLFCPFPPQKWCMVSSQGIWAKVQLCPAQITLVPLNLGSPHVILMFGQTWHRPGRWIWI